LSKTIGIAAAAIGALALAACTSTATPAPAAVTGTGAGSADTLTGAGSTYVAPSSHWPSPDTISSTLRSPWGIPPWPGRGPGSRWSSGPVPPPVM